MKEVCGVRQINYLNNMKKTILKSAIVLGAMTPFLASAQEKNLAWLVVLVVQYLNYAVYLIMGLAIVMFVWNIYKYFIAGGDNADGKKEAGMYVMWSVIGFFVILSFWGLVNILTNTVKLNNNVPATGIFGSFSSAGGTGSMGAFGTNGTNGGGFGESMTNLGGNSMTNTGGNGITNGTSGSNAGLFVRMWNFFFASGK